MTTRRIAVLTSGGDAPGMNAAIRAVTRTGVNAGMEVLGVRNGYTGLIAGDFFPLGLREVGGIIQHGGTILGSTRCQEFKTDEGLEKARQAIRAGRLEGVVIIGGNGSQAGAYSISQMGVPVVGVASTIDNDLVGSEITIGVDTALNIALEAIDRLKTTAASHQRAFLVEVMGRDCGYLALMAGIAGGAEIVAIPERPCDPESIARALRAAYDRGKTHAIGVVSEGAKHKVFEIATYFRDHKQEIGFDLRVTSLGHVQRGGVPGAFDRILAARFGAAAVEVLTRGESGVLVGLQRGRVTTTPLSEVAHKKRTLDLKLMDLVQILSS